MHYGGHSSWIGIVVLAAVFGFRVLSSQRSRRGGRGAPTASSAFTATDAPRPGPAGPRGPVPPGFTGIAPGWLTDPFCRHEQRFWSGTAWTEHVVDDGVPGTDPPPPMRSRGDRPADGSGTGVPPG